MDLGWKILRIAEFPSQRTHFLNLNRTEMMLCMHQDNLYFTQDTDENPIVTIGFVENVNEDVHYIVLNGQTCNQIEQGLLEIRENAHCNTLIVQGSWKFDPLGIKSSLIWANRPLPHKYERTSLSFDKEILLFSVLLPIYIISASVSENILQNPFHPILTTYFLTTLFFGATLHNSYFVRL